MTSSSWLRGLTQFARYALKKSRHSAAHTRDNRYRPSVERLEDRTLMAYDLGFALGLGSTEPDGGVAIAVDAQQNTYVLGSFYRTVDLDPSAGEYVLTSSGEGGSSSGDYLAKYSPEARCSGASSWATPTTTRRPTSPSTPLATSMSPAASPGPPRSVPPLP